MRLTIIDTRQSAKAAIGNPRGNNLNAGGNGRKAHKRKTPAPEGPGSIAGWVSGGGWGRARHPALIRQHRAGASVPDPFKNYFRHDQRPKALPATSRPSQYRSWGSLIACYQQGAFPNNISISSIYS